MQGSRGISTIVAVVAALVVISAVAVPVISSVANDVHATAENTGYNYRVEMYDTSTTYKIEKTDAGIAVNGVEYTAETYISDVLGGYSSDKVVYVSDLTTVRINTTADGMEIRLFGITGTKSTVYSLTTTGSYVEWSGGTETFYAASNGATYTIDFTFLIAPEPNGSWGVFPNSAGVGVAWVTFGGTYYTATTSYPADNYTNSVVRITQGESAEVVRAVSLVDSVVADVTIDVTESVFDTDDRSALVGTPTIDYDGTDQTATYFVIAPLSYQVVTDSQQTVLSLVNVIPLMLVLMVLIVAAYAIIRAKDE